MVSSMEILVGLTKKIPNKSCMYASRVYAVLNRIFHFFEKIALRLSPALLLLSGSDLFSFQAKPRSANSVSHHHRPIEYRQPGIFNHISELWKNRIFTISDVIFLHS